MNVCTFLFVDAKDGIPQICGEPADVIANGASMCSEHFKMMAEQSFAQMKAYLTKMQQQGGSIEDDDEGGAVEVPTFDIKTPDYLR